MRLGKVELGWVGFDWFMLGYFGLCKIRLGELMWGSLD